MTQTPSEKTRIKTNTQLKPRAKPKSDGLKAFEERVAEEIRMLIAKKIIRLKVISHGLEQLGIRESEKGLSAKLKAGTFSAAYYVAIKQVIENL
ncbi:DUF6471 domain-containing protein [Limnobacter sp.]|uniref:DUF6471 domain-containing protein n=1 Tax=Limnobacter sp. TaxID=2003368 RepID=UPI002590DBD3|nr:DUF6471 domain-containing protein [Limnobacter sp.]